MGWKDAAIVDDGSAWSKAPLAENKKPLKQIDLNGPQEVSALEGIAANPVIRGAVSAASLPLSAMEWIPGIGNVVKDSRKRYGEMVERGKTLQSNAQKTVGDVAEVGGLFLDPLGYATGQSALKTVQGVKALSKSPVIANALAGGLAGVTAAGIEGKDLSDTATQGAMGAAIPLALGGAGRAGRLVWNAVDQAVSPQGAQMAAGRVATQASGDKYDEIVDALSKSGRMETGRQAIVPTGNRELSGMLKMGEQNAPTPSGIRLDEQVARRMQSLESVKPDMASAVNARYAQIQPRYAAVEATTIPLDQPLQEVINRIPKSVIATAQETAKMKNAPFDLKSGQISGSSIDYIKKALSDMANAPATSAVGKSQKNAAGDLLDDFLRTVESPIRMPGYGAARLGYERMSRPVNQSQVIQDVQDVTKGIAGTERLGPLVNAIERGKLGDELSILEPRQRKVVEAVIQQSEKAKMSDRFAQQGQTKARDMFNAEEIPISIPNLLSRPVAVANAILRRAEGAGKQATLDELSRLNLNPRELAEVMKTASAKQKRWMMENIMAKTIPITVAPITEMSGEQQ